MWYQIQKLRQSGILGMNRRNVFYIAGHNPRSLYPRVDDKLQTKIFAQKAGIATPELYGVVRCEYEARRLHEVLADHRSFVIKPAHGSAGKGILVVSERKGDHFLSSGGKEKTWQDLHRHLSNILSGLYSLGGREDVAMIEALIDFDDLFENYTYQGVPDIRVIVFQGYPVMSMVRLSTRRSGGRANLHQGAVGLGIDLGTGCALKAVMQGRRIEKHPDTDQNLFELVIPQWSKMLELAASCYDVTGLGYLGVDIVLDRRRGPMVIELNARPGLSIQIANGQGILPRLRKIESLDYLDPSAQARAAFSAENFCAFPSRVSGDSYSAKQGE